MAAAAVRFFTSSLHRMCSTCLQIVPVDALRITPISQFVFPCATQTKTSVSRAVRPNEQSGFCSATSLLFLFTLCFLRESFMSPSIFAIAVTGIGENVRIVFSIIFAAKLFGFAWVRVDNPFLAGGFIVCAFYTWLGRMSRKRLHLRFRHIRFPHKLPGWPVKKKLQRAANAKTQKE